MISKLPALVDVKVKDRKRKNDLAPHFAGEEPNSTRVNVFRARVVAVKNSLGKSVNDAIARSEATVLALQKYVTALPKNGFRASFEAFFILSMAQFTNPSAKVSVADHERYFSSGEVTFWKGEYLLDIDIILIGLVASSA